MTDEIPSTPQVVGRNVARLLSEHSMTQVELARRLGVDPSTVGQYIRGQINMSVATLKQIADILDSRPCHLLLDGEPAAA